MWQLNRAAILLGTLVLAAGAPALGATPQVVLTVSEVPVGDQGTVATGALEISSDTDLAGTTFTASNLVAGAAVIPAQAITFDPLVVDVTGGSTYTVGISVQIPPAQPLGTYTGTVMASDGAVQSLVAVSVVVNNRPTLVVPGPQTVAAGSTLSFNISGTDPDGQPVALGVRFLPEGAELIDHGNGVGTFTYRPELEAAGLDVTLIFFAFNRSEVGAPAQDAREVPISVVAPTAASIPQLITDLGRRVRSSDLRRGIEQSLSVKLQQALSSFDRGDAAAACGQVNAFVNEARAQSGKALSTAQAALLDAGAAEIVTALGCR
jgi:hypothetical protein